MVDAPFVSQPHSAQGIKEPRSQSGHSIFKEHTHTQSTPRSFNCAQAKISCAIYTNCPACIAFYTLCCGFSAPVDADGTLECAVDIFVYLRQTTESSTVDKLHDDYMSLLSVHNSGSRIYVVGITASPQPTIYKHLRRRATTCIPREHLAANAGKVFFWDLCVCVSMWLLHLIRNARSNVNGDDGDDDREHFGPAFDTEANKLQFHLAVG